MGAASKKVVLGVGGHAARYDLRYPRSRAVYVEDLDDAPRIALAYAVGGVVISGGPAGVIIECVRQLRRVISPSAPIAVVDRRAAAIAEQLEEAGATLCAESWLAVEFSFAVELRRARPIRRTPAVLSVASRRLQ